MSLQIILTICLGVGYLVGHSAIESAKCPPDEYRVGLECCPSCPPGKRVSKDCTERRITQCSWCPNGTFQAGRNEQKQCSSCIKCDAGLKVKRSCTSTSDALCETLDGFFCSDFNGGGYCRTAQRHTVCSPGEYIGLRGTADEDTECLQCTNGTFSNGTSCQPHTKCESVGLELMKPGTDSTDSECGEHGSHKGLVAGVISGVILVVASMALIIMAIIQRKKIRALVYRRRDKKRGINNTDYKLVSTTDHPGPTGDQQQPTTTTAAATIDDHDGDQSLGPAPPSSPKPNGSVSVTVHQEDDPPVPIRRDNGASPSTPLSLVLPSPSPSTPLSLVSWSSLLSLGLPSTSKSARRFPSKSESSCLENPSDRVSLLMDNDVVEEEVPPVRENRDQPGSESDALNSLKSVPFRRDNGVAKATPLSLTLPTTSQSASWSYVRSMSVPSHFKFPSPRDSVSLLKGNDIAEEEVLPSESDDSNSDTRGGNTPV